MADKITYTDKEYLINDETIPDKNKVLDTDLNEIKEVVNNNADELDIATANIEELQETVESQGSAINELQEDNTTNKANIQENTTDISNIKAEQTTQNTRISDLETDNETNKSNISTNTQNIATLQIDSGHTLELDLNNTTYILTATLKNKAGTVLSTSTVDFPVEQLVLNVEYDTITKELVITLKNGQVTRVPLSSIINGLVSQTDFDNLEDRVEGLESDIPEYINNYSVINSDFIFKNRKMKNNLVVNENKTVDFSNNIVSLSNFQSLLTDNSNSISISNPFRIRYSSGKLIFTDIEWVKYSNHSQGVLFFFDKSGNHMRNNNVYNNNITEDITTYFPNDAYYMCIKYYGSYGDCDIYINDKNVEWLKSTQINNYIKDFSVMPQNFKYKKSQLRANVHINEGKTYTGTVGVSRIDNITYSNSSVADISDLIQLKYDNGEPIIEKWNWKNMPSSSAEFLFYFDVNGVLESKVTINNHSNTIPSTAYYCLVKYFNNLGKKYDSYFEDENVEWLKNESVYYVGSDTNDDYNSFYGCLEALKNDESKKTIYVKSGTYNLVEEIKAIKGNDYLLNISSSATWNNINILVPKNTKIIGLGNVVLNYLPEDNEVNEYAMNLISPINTNTVCQIENMIINCKNCRYGIHDEAGTSSNNYFQEHKYKNIKIYFTGTNGYGQAFGSGFVAGMNYEFDNCIFSSTHNNPFSIHNGYVPSADSSNYTLYSANIEFRNCKFIMPGNNNNSELLLINAEQTNQLYVNVNISNCFFKNQKIGIYRQTSTGTYINAYKLIINNSNISSNDNIVIAENVINNLPIEIYNPITLETLNQIPEGTEEEVEE